MKPCIVNFVVGQHLCLGEATVVDAKGVDRWSRLI